MISAPARPADSPDAAPVRARRSIHRPLLVGVLLLALGLRAWGLDWQLPAVLYHDELKYALSASYSAEGVESAPADYRNASLLRHLLNLEYLLLPLLGQPPISGPAGTSGEAVAARIMLGRLTVLLFGVGSVGLLYLAGRRTFGRRVGLLAAALLAVNFLHVQLSHLSVNDVPAGFLLVAALVPTAGLLGRRAGSGGVLAAAALAGLLSGLAAAAKYNFGVVILAPLIACGLLGRRGPAWRGVALRAAGLVVASALVGFLVGMPEVLWSFAEVREGIARQSAIGDRRWAGQVADPIPLLYGQALVRAFGWPGLAAALAGIVLALAAAWRGTSRVADVERERRGDSLPRSLVLIVPPVLYLGYMATKELFFARFALPAVPFLCLFAAYAVIRGWERLPRAPWRTPLLVGACMLVLGPPLVLAIRFDGLLGRTDTRVLAERWVRANVPPGSPLAVQAFALPIRFSGDPIEQAYRITSFSGLMEPRQLSELACAGSRYVAVSSFTEERQRVQRRAGRTTGYDLLATRGQLLATFWPGPNDTATPFDVDDDGPPFWHTEHYARTGSTIRIYALPADAC